MDVNSCGTAASDDEEQEQERRPTIALLLERTAATIPDPARREERRGTSAVPGAGVPARMEALTTRSGPAGRARQ